MKCKHVFLLSLLLLAMMGGALGLRAQDGVAVPGHRISVQLKGLADTTLILGYYYGESKYVADTALIDANGRAEFRGDSLLPQGMYLVLLPSKQYFDILLGEDQTIDIQVDTTDLFASQRIEGARVSEDFLRFQRFMSGMQEKSVGVRRLDSMARAKNAAQPADTEEYKQARELGKQLDDEVRQYHAKLMAAHPDDVLGKFCRATIAVEIPEYTPAEGVKNVDSMRWLWSYRYNTEHYLDNVDLSSPAMLRTPLALPKVEFFLDKMVVQLPDSISKYCDQVIARAGGNEETYRFFVSHLLNKYQISEIVGMDAVFVHIAEQYYLEGKTPWVSQEVLGQIDERVKALKPNLIGQIAPDFSVEQLHGGQFRLSQSKHRVTVLVFWEPSCSHCKTVVPKLDSVARIYAPKGVHVVGFMTQGDGPLWQKYVSEHDLSLWTHVWDPYRKSHFHKNYDIRSTPVIYILDENKRIVVKRIGVESVGPIVEDMLKL